MYMRMLWLHYGGCYGDVLVCTFVCREQIDDIVTAVATVGPSVLYLMWHWGSSSTGKESTQG